jgi:hypothetical protein
MWLCDICTFINDEWKLQCEMCSTRHPNEILSSESKHESKHESKRIYKEEKKNDKIIIFNINNMPECTTTTAKTTLYSMGLKCSDDPDKEPQDESSDDYDDYSDDYDESSDDPDELTFR